MKIDWNPSTEVLAKMKKIKDLKKQGKTYEEIAKELGNDRTYIIALNRKYKQMTGEV